MASVLSGIDILLAAPPAWHRQRIGLVTNHAATTQGFEPSRSALLRAGFNIVRLFSPEHGLAVTGADGHRMFDGEDALTGLPVRSLYGPRLGPQEKDLEDIDMLLFDVPDIGSRFYTYLWTLTHVMESAAAFGRKLVIADRPNPLSGNLQLAEGPMLDEASCSSFIGRWRVPVRHSCTLGELALYFNAVRGIGADVEVIACRNLGRSDVYPGGMRSFVPTSPAINSFESAMLYPGLCLLEATNCSEGRGTAVPFRVAGAPWLRAEETAAVFNRLAPAGSVTARAIQFTPAEGKYANRLCEGLMLHPGDFHHFHPVATGWLLIDIIRRLHPGEFEWAPYPTHVNSSGGRHLDLLTGIPGAEGLFETDRCREWQQIEALTAVPEWAEMVGPYLLYT